jgi:hypothetical protein
MKSVGTDTSGKWMGVEHAESFAKIIVFECIKLAVFKGDTKTATAIKDHFGIE